MRVSPLILAVLCLFALPVYGQEVATVKDSATTDSAAPKHEIPYDGPVLVIVDNTSQDDVRVYENGRYLGRVAHYSENCFIISNITRHPRLTIRSQQRQLDVEFQPVSRGYRIAVRWLTPPESFGLAPYPVKSCLTEQQ